MEYTNKLVRRLKASVQLNNNGITEEIYKSTDKLFNFTIERVGEESKFFGFGICQKINVHLVSSENKITTTHSLKPFIEDDSQNIGYYPNFYVTEVNRNENSGELSITGYDKLYNASAHTISELNTTVTTIIKLAENISELLGCTALVIIHNETDNIDSFYNEYSEAVLTNFDGSETIRSVLDSIAEATQTIYYIDSEDNLVFKRLSKDGEAEYTINKNDYFSLKSGDNRRLVNLVSATELGDNLTATLKGQVSGETIVIDDVSANEHILEVKIECAAPETNTLIVFGEDEASAATYIPNEDGTVSGVTSISPVMHLKTSAAATITVVYERENTISGTTQYIRNNPFWDLRADRADLVDKALAVVWGFTINQFECDWRGNFLLNIGDKIELETKDNTKVTSYILNDVIVYDGGLNEKTKWSYQETEETASNASNLGEILAQTFAKVDKVNKKIEMAINQADGNTNNINQIILDTNNIKASVKSIENIVDNSIDGINESLDTLTEKVEAAITAEDVQLKIEKELENGIGKVTTSTGYTFNDEGLTVSKSNSEMKTTITDDGMRVFKNNQDVLIADNTGVKAKNLHSTTYLIIGNTSRFEDFSGRTGCFWIG